jgi:hypothetical protein
MTTSRAVSRRWPDIFSAISGNVPPVNECMPVNGREAA